MSWCQGVVSYVIVSGRGVRCLSWGAVSGVIVSGSSVRCHNFKE